MRKGQEALEYIITYGWGFLVIIVILGALGYFGFLSPTRYVPARCDFGQQLACVDYKLASDAPNGAIYLQFRNNFGDDIIITKAYTFSEAGSATVTAPSSIISQGNVSSIFKVVPTAANQLSSGDRVSVPMVITFRRAYGTPTPPEHNVTGTVFATIQ